MDPKAPAFLGPSSEPLYLTHVNAVSSCDAHKARGLHGPTWSGRGPRPIQTRPDPLSSTAREASDERRSEGASERHARLPSAAGRASASPSREHDTGSAQGSPVERRRTA